MMNKDQMNAVQEIVELYNEAMESLEPFIEDERYPALSKLVNRDLSAQLRTMYESGKTPAHDLALIMASMTDRGQRGWVYTVITFLETLI